MKVLSVTNVNNALSAGIEYLLAQGIPETSRNGPVLVAPGPVVTQYQFPKERVLFSPTRDANPFFHLMESLWILSGDNDLEFPMYFNSKFAAFSDDGKTVNGSAYGYRWRHYFEYDQLEAAIEELRKKPDSRRVVLGMWNPMSLDEPTYHLEADLRNQQSKDIPCNTHAYVDLRGGQLNLTICNRSNDIIWGAYGANAVHFSFLQEYLACALGVPVGTYYQFSNNYHLYTEVFGMEKLQRMAQEGFEYNLYDQYLTSNMHVPLMKDFQNWHLDLAYFMLATRVVFKKDEVDQRGIEFREPFFKEVAWPMFMAWWAYKRHLTSAKSFALSVGAQDWKKAAFEWIYRKEKAREQRAQTSA